IGSASIDEADPDRLAWPELEAAHPVTAVGREAHPRFGVRSGAPGGASREQHAVADGEGVSAGIEHGGGPVARVDDPQPKRMVGYVDVAAVEYGTVVPAGYRDEAVPEPAGVERRPVYPFRLGGGRQPGGEPVDRRVLLGEVVIRD